jgi:hypothetical protein
MPTATVQVRQTTTTTTARASVLVINSGYLTSKLGLLKLVLLVWKLFPFKACYSQSLFANIPLDKLKNFSTRKTFSYRESIFLKIKYNNLTIKE